MNAKTRRRSIFIAALGITAFPATEHLAQAAPSLDRIGMESLCVTNGVVTQTADAGLAVLGASSRGVVRGSDGGTAEMHFRYLGPSADSKPLASGELRRQIGLKLRAQDSCNLLYVMWHIEPDEGIRVLIKSNPTKHTHAECHTNGYTSIRPLSSAVLPPIRPGEAHTLRAELRGTQVTVFADARRAWVGTVGTTLDAIDGPVGFRTDNGRFGFEYLAILNGSEGNPQQVSASHLKCEPQLED